MSENGRSNGHSPGDLEEKEVLMESEKSSLEANAEESEKESRQVPIPTWMDGVKKYFRIFLWVAGITLLWLTLSYFKVLPPRFVDNGNFLVSVILFLLAIPTGLFVGMSSMLERYAAEGATEIALLSALPIVLLNLMVIGAYRGWSRGFKARQALNQNQNEQE